MVYCSVLRSTAWFFLWKTLGWAMHVHCCAVAISRRESTDGVIIKTWECGWGDWSLRHVWLVCPDLQQAHRKSYHLWVKLEDSAAVEYLWSFSLSQTAMYQLPLWLFLGYCFYMTNGFLLETDTLLTSPLLSNFLIGEEAWQNQDTSILSLIYKQAWWCLLSVRCMTERCWVLGGWQCVRYLLWLFVSLPSLEGEEANGWWAHR